MATRRESSGTGGSGRGKTDRETATFEPYFWEAYNEIARPDRYDWYLITRWLPDLGPEGFAILKALRNLCYFNPRDGVLRDTCQITTDELAEMVGMSRSAVYRAMEGNAALAHFAQRMPEAIHVEGRTRRLPPRWRVCMDTPIHPLDMEQYDLLRANREGGRVEDEEKKRKSQIEIYEKRKSQTEISGGRKSQNDERKSQNPGRKSQDGITNKEIPIPPVFIPSDRLRPSVAADPPINSPQGDGEGEQLGVIWTGVQERLLAQVQTGEINSPSYHGHLALLHLASLTETLTGAVAVIASPSAFTREWVEKRHGDRLAGALAAVLDRDPAYITVEIRGPGK